MLIPTPYWSPDGSQIAFNSTRDAKEGERKLEIYVMDADGSNVKQVTDDRFAQRPRWSPDGKRILFEAGEVYAIRPDGTEQWQVSNPRLDALMILGGWSPGGKQVLYTEAVNINPDTSFPFIATLGGKRGQEVLHWKRVKVPRMPFNTAAFSADGKSILFSGQKDFGMEEAESDAWNIYRFEIIGKKLIQLTDNLSVPAQQGLLPQQWGQLKAVTGR